MTDEYIVYSICFEDGAEYVGITRQNLAARVRQHMVGGAHNKKVLKRILTGRPFTVKVREEGLGHEEALELEEWYILSAPKSLNGFHVFARYKGVAVAPLPDRCIKSFRVSNYLRSIYLVEKERKHLNKFVNLDVYVNSSTPHELRCVRTIEGQRQIEQAHCVPAEISPQ